eukprot:g6216.t1
MSARATKRGRSTAFTVGSPLVGRRHTKRAGKSPGPAVSPGPPGSKGVAASALATGESDIVLDRLGKEVVALLKEGGSQKDAVRRRLRLGINEVTKFLEATATALAAASYDPNARSPSTTTTASTSDVRPSRLMEHIHALVKLTATPYLVLSGSSRSLGRVFGCKTMAAMAICPARSTPPPAAAAAAAAAALPHSSTDRDGKTEGGPAAEKKETIGDHNGSGGVVAGYGAQGWNGERDGDTTDAGAAVEEEKEEEEEEGGRQYKDRGEGGSQGMVQVGGGHGEKKKKEAAGEGKGKWEERSGGAMGSSAGCVRGAESTAGVLDDRARARADEDVDWFVEFLLRKVK